MVNLQASRNETGSRRHIGPIGTIARVVLGLVLLLDGLLGGNLVLNHGQVRTGFVPAGVLHGLVGFRPVLLACQSLRARRQPSSFEPPGPLGTTLHTAASPPLLRMPRSFPLPS